MLSVIRVTSIRKNCLVFLRLGFARSGTFGACVATVVLLCREHFRRSSKSWWETRVEVSRFRAVMPTFFHEALDMCVRR